MNEKPQFEWIRQSNLIEGVDDLAQDVICFHAWEWFKKQFITRKTILDLHGRVMLSLLPEYAGRFRTLNVRVGPRICPAWEKVEDLMEDWLKNHGAAHTELRVKGAHIRFEQIHPFVDGNGRVGRMIMNHQRVNHGMEALNIKAEERWKYYDWFSES